LWLKIFPSDLPWTTAQGKSKGKQTVPPASQPDLIYDTLSIGPQKENKYDGVRFTKFE
jgi:hypothetical protein